MAARVKAKEPAQDEVEVTVVHPYQVNHEGTIAGPGEKLTVPRDVAERWKQSGLADF